MGRWIAATLAVGLLAGCGGPEGVEEGAVLNAYVSSALCAEAKRSLVAVGGRAGDVRVRAVCVADRGARGSSRLAAVGAAARRASEDSSSVAYIGTPDPVAVRFSEPILEEAGIARLSARSGGAAMEKLLAAIRGSDAASLREAVFDRFG